MKTTQEQIAEIIERRYSGFRPKGYRSLQQFHNLLRNIRVPYSNWQLFKNYFFGIKLPPQKVINIDEEYLKLLQKLERDLPRPKYRMSEELLNSLPKELSDKIKEYEQQQ